MFQLHSFYSIDDVLMKNINRIFPTKHKKKGAPKDAAFVCSGNDKVQNNNQFKLYSAVNFSKGIKNIPLPLILRNRDWRVFS